MQPLSQMGQDLQAHDRKWLKGLPRKQGTEWGLGLVCMEVVARLLKCVEAVESLSAALAAQ